MISKFSGITVLILVILLTLWTPVSGKTLQPQSVAAHHPAPVLAPASSINSRDLAASHCAASYIVKSGDTLSSIAAACGVTTNALAAANGLQLTDTIYVGQRLIIPSTSTSATPAASSKTKIACANPYIVRRGDTLSKIARLCGVSIASLKRWNGLKTDTIRIGQSLVTRAKTPTLMVSPATTPVPGLSPVPSVEPAPPMPTPTTMIEPPIVK